MQEVECPGGRMLSNHRMRINPHGIHVLAVYYRRPWYKPWHKQNVIACWYCDLEIREPM